MNPHTAPWLDERLAADIDAIRPLDEEGSLYSIRITGDYDTPAIREVMLQTRLLQSGCSAFMTHAHNGDVLTGRNYDFRHRALNKEENPPTVLLFAVHCAPKDGYRSVGIADAFWLDAQSGIFYQGVPQDGKTDLSLAALLPYIIMDGMNECGVTVSILMQGNAPGETCVDMHDPDKEHLTYTVFMRRVLDKCDSVDAAIALAERCNMHSTTGSDYHIFITDRSGRSVVLEWRHNRLYVTETDLVTNFYVGFDDAQPRLNKDGSIRESVIRVEGTARPYRYGFGGGYQRFGTLACMLQRHVDMRTGAYMTCMTSEEARDLLRAASQGSSPGDSMTQHSVLYNSTTGTARLWIKRRYEKEYLLSIHD